MGTITKFFKLALEKKALLSAFVIAAVVGTILNVINQVENYSQSGLRNIRLTQVILTYCVPFFVSLISATSAKMKFSAGELTPMNATVKCVHCGSSVMIINSRKVMPPCDNCGE